MDDTREEETEESAESISGDEYESEEDIKKEFEDLRRHFKDVRKRFRDIDTNKEFEDMRREFIRLERVWAGIMSGVSRRNKRQRRNEQMNKRTKERPI